MWSGRRACCIREAGADVGYPVGAWPRRPEPRPRAPKRVLLAAPRGYCAGVDRAVQTVEEALDLYGPPVYVRKEIVHNKHVVEQLAERGAIFVEEETEVPEGALVVFSAHGVAPKVHENARQRAACGRSTQPARWSPRSTSRPASSPSRATRSCSSVTRATRRSRGRPARRRTASCWSQTAEDVDSLEVPDPEKVAYITQTTLSVDETAGIIARLREKFPDDRRPEVRRHLLRDHQPPDRRQGAGARMRPGAGHRLHQLLELEPPGRGGARARRRLAPDRQRAPGRGGVARGVETVGHHLRRERSRGAGRSSWSASSASAGPRTSRSCGPSTRTSASCSRRRSGPSWLPGVE